MKMSKYITSSMLAGKQVIKETRILGGVEGTVLNRVVRRVMANLSKGLKEVKSMSWNPPDQD